MARNYIIGLICLSLFVACTGKDRLLENALTQAGTNRVELEKVLDRYRDTDEEKYRAACFLIRNMPFYHSCEGKELEKYWHYFKAHSTNNKGAQYIVDSLEQADGLFSMALLTKRKDIEVVDSAFLATHIDWAFKVWREQPWGKHVTFRDFCEYILPYRIGDEPLSLWREELYGQYNSLLDSLRATSSATDPLQAAQVVLTHLQQWKYRYTSLFPVGPHVGPNILQWRAGSCRDLSDGLIYVCRALGIPCGTDQVLLRGDCNTGHFWNFTLDKTGMSYVTDFPNEGVWKPCKDYIVKRKGKVYRITYSLNEYLMKQGGKVLDIYPTFRTPFFHDVTLPYLEHPRKFVEIEKESLQRVPANGETVYLCLSSKQEWVPIDYIQYQGGNIRFERIEGGITCIVALWKHHRIIPLCSPFHVDECTSEIRYYNPKAECQTVNLYMKFHMPAHDYLYERMLGGVIEGSSSEDFEQADTVYAITEKPYRRFNIARLKTEKSYRYMRYRGAKDSHSHIAELGFYGKDTMLLQGRVIGTPSSQGKDGRYEYPNVFDGNTETSFEYAEEGIGWAGMDFGRPMRVEKAVYTPANRVNFIYKGYDYELYYWADGRWNSLGRQTATADSLVYRAPVNALLYLKCHSEGKEERIFEYKDEKQIFR